MHRFIAIAAALLFLAPLAGSGGPPDVTLEIVKRKGYDDTLLSLRGKVVVVDVWGEFCIPCKKEFPHMVELHEKHAGRGLACVSVSLDLPDAQAAALKFLTKEKAVFTNILLDEPPKVWQEIFDIYGPPAVLVFDKNGKLAARFDHNIVDKSYTHDDVEKAVAKLLEK